LFTQSDRPIVERILVERVGANLPLVADDADLVERVRYAVLKLSGGDVQDLERHVGVACVDWRDVLVAAGFGRDPRAHLKWNP
jgi:hypothetical protein